MGRRRYRRRRTTRLERRAYSLLAAAALAAWACQTHPVWTGLAAALAVAGGVAWVYVKRRKGRQGWIYHLPGWPGLPLVYLGKTCWPERRMAQHQGLQGPASWFAADVDFSRVQWFGPFPERDLSRIEADHIHTYQPWANQQRYEAQRRLQLLRHESARSRRTVA